MPDFTLKPTFPIASVIDAAQKKAQLEQESQRYGQQQFTQGLQSIGEIGQSLVAQRRNAAQALVLGKALGMAPEEIQGLSPDQVLETAKVKASQMDPTTLMQGLSTIAGVPSPANSAAPGAASGAGAAAQSIDLHKLIGKSTADFLIKAANDARMAGQFNRSQAQQEQHFQVEQGRKTTDKTEQITKETEDKNQAIYNAANAIKQSLDLKKASASGPVAGRGAALLGNVTSGALAGNTYQLVQHNMRNAPTLQHAQEVNRFNPQEVQSLNVSNFSQPGEPFNISQEKAYNAAKTFATRINQNELEKTQKLTALGIKYTPKVLKPEDLIPGVTPAQPDQPAQAQPAVPQETQAPSELTHLSTKDLMDLRKKLSAHKPNGNQS